MFTRREEPPDSRTTGWLRDSNSLERWKNMIRQENPVLAQSIAPAAGVSLDR
jgi:hypothetical protein